MSAPTRDLVALVADADIDFAMRGLLARVPSLGIRPLVRDIYRHPRRDPGCLLEAHEFLSSYTSRYQHALVVFDRDGCGAEHRSRLELEQEVEARLARTGWGDRAAVIAIDPELEAWVWSDSPHVATALGWDRQHPDLPLRQWLESESWLGPSDPKPTRPKEAMNAALCRPRSADIYLKLASTVGLTRCVDPAFAKLTQTLARWFPVSTP